MIDLFVRASDGRIIDKIDIFTELSSTLRFRAVGSWVLKAPLARGIERLLEAKGNGLVIVRDGATLMSGLRDQNHGVWKDDADELTISGYSDEKRLWDLMAYPSARVQDGSLYRFPSAATDQRKGAAETAMKGFVGFNASRIANGVQPITIAPDLGRGLQVVESPRFDPLGDVLASTAIHGGGLGFSLKSEIEGTRIAPLVFDVYQPRDLRKRAVFSTDSHNIEQFSYTEFPPTATHVICAGQGEGTERIFAVAENNSLATLWGRRVEVFIDARNISDPVELQQKADEELAERSGRTELSIKPIDSPGRSFGETYGCGDLATAQDVEGILQEIELTFDADGESIDSSFATSATAANAYVNPYWDQIRKASRAIQSLQRSQ